jgi:hypothetical protein
MIDAEAGRIEGQRIRESANVRRRGRIICEGGTSGQWKRDYVPAYIRRYPFFLAKASAGPNLTVCIDESYAGFGADEGQRLFNDKGESTDYLKGVLIHLVANYHQSGKKKLVSGPALSSFGGKSNRTIETSNSWH